VLLREVLRHLQLRPGLLVVDGTVGGGGHSRGLVDAIGPAGRLIGLDRDASMLERARNALPDASVTLIHDSYVHLRRVLDGLQVEGVDRILVDLGLSSDQLADAERGFSFDAPGPLDLRFDTSQGEPAWRLLMTWNVDALEQVLREYGEEPLARRIAERLVTQRETLPIRTARDLATLVSQAYGLKAESGRHPATRAFQALRIAVNCELDAVETAVNETFPACLNPGGLLAVITFHSLEDRLVKEAFRNRNVWEPVTDKPVAPTPQEVRFNPRSRSAKLRVARLKMAT
jgi:16S rRNA (cytosine1402-N4)-methyltransferase